MTTTESTLRYARGKNMTLLELGKLLMERHEELTAADATRLMDEYKRHNPKGAELVEKLNKQYQAKREAQQPAIKAAAEKTLRTEGPYTVAQLTKQRSCINRKSVKALALVLSEAKHGKKFSRVGRAFFQHVEADFDVVLRDLGKTPIPAGTASLINFKAVKGRLLGQLNNAVFAIVARRVNGQDRIGKTLR